MMRMGFTTLATAAVTAVKALPDALQAYSFNKQGKALNKIAAEQESLANTQAARMENTAVANQQRAARNAAAQMGAARADAAASNLMSEGSAHVRETDLATRTRQQGKLNAWNTRHAAAQAKMSSVGAGLSAAGNLFSGIAGQLKE